MLRHRILVVLYILCIIILLPFCTSEEKTKSDYEPSYDKTLNITAKTLNTDGYSSLIASCLGLDSLRTVGLKRIIHTYEVERVGHHNGSKTVKRLKENRNEDLENFLTRTELQQLRFVRLRYYKFPLKNPKQVTTIQALVGMSDGQVLKYIDIVERFRVNNNKTLMNQRLMELLGDKYQKLLDLGIFYK